MQNTESRTLIQNLLDTSRHEGRDLWDVMERDGFLLTPTRARQIKSEALTHLRYILDRETAERVLQRYLGGRPATPQDMFDAMLEWLKDYQEGIEAGHVD